MSYRQWGGGCVFLCDGTMLPSHVKDYYSFKAAAPQEEVAQTVVGGRGVSYALYHIDRTLKNVMRLKHSLSLTLPQAAKIVRKLENSSASLNGFTVFATDHQELNLDEALRIWKPISKQRFALLNTTISGGVNIE